MILMKGECGCAIRTRDGLVLRADRPNGLRRARNAAMGAMSFHAKVEDPDKVPQAPARSALVPRLGHLEGRVLLSGSARRTASDSQRGLAHLAQCSQPNGHYEWIARRPWSAWLRPDQSR